MVQYRRSTSRAETRLYRSRRECVLYGGSNRATAVVTTSTGLARHLSKVFPEKLHPASGALGIVHHRPQAGLIRTDTPLERCNERLDFRLRHRSSHSAKRAL